MHYAENTTGDTRIILFCDVERPLRSRVMTAVNRWVCHLDVHRPWRKVKVSDSRAAVDFAVCMRKLTDVHFPKAEYIRVILDNLSTHSAGALYHAFAPCAPAG